MKKIEELHDLKVNHWFDFDKYHEEPLLDYVWQVANEFLPTVIEDAGVLDDSKAPAIFANRYFESKLSIEERYNRFKEIHPNSNCTFEEYANYRKNERLLDASFKEKYLSNKALQETLKVFKIDVSKFWYLLLFIHDYITDISTDTMANIPSTWEQLKRLQNKLSNETTSIIIKNNNRKCFETNDPDVFLFIKSILGNCMLDYYNIVTNKELNEEERYKLLEEKGMYAFINDAKIFDPQKRINLDKTYSKLKFLDMFNFFLKDKKAKTDPTNPMRVSKDKMLLVSRLLYVTGREDESYNEEFINCQKNRKLTDSLGGYKIEDCPPVIANYYL